MKPGYLFCAVFLTLTLTSVIGYAEVYVNEDFEQFAEGDDIGVEVAGKLTIAWGKIKAW